MAGHRGRWNKKAPAGIILLLMCMCVPSLMLQTTEKQCPTGDYLTDEGNCCNKCPPGFKLVEKCHATGQRSNCTPCPHGQYTDQMNYFENCRSCKRCKESNNEVEVSKCERYHDTICQCKDGFYKFKIDSITSECRKCAQCGPNEKRIHVCTSEKNTVCECMENYYKVQSKCELCKNCTSECSHHCSTPSHTSTKDPYRENTFLINIIAGVSAAALLLLFLVFLVTYTTTKLFTKKKLLKLSEPTSVSLDMGKQFLLNVEEPWENHGVKAVPQIPLSEQESTNLPDCVPLEIKIPDLIYTVLDLVPVQQVKQLVRTLGVKDTEIEQAETDHRSCREAHYQMLRVWAERGSCAGRGGRGGMLHWQLLEELLVQLKNMHLGRAAEELETKYSIQ